MKNWYIFEGARITRYWTKRGALLALHKLTACNTSEALNLRTGEAVNRAEARDELLSNRIDVPLPGWAYVSLGFSTTGLLTCGVLALLKLWGKI